MALSIDSESTECNASFDRSEQDAAELAIALRNKIYGIEGDNNSRSVSDVSVTPVFSTTRSRGNDSPLYYAVDYPNKSGYTIIPVDTRIAPLIITEEGCFHDATLSENPSFNAYLKATEDYLNEKADPQFQNPTDTSYTIPIYQYLDFDTIHNTRITPKVAVKWGQRFKLAKYCPNGVVGCGPLAIAMLASSLEEPKQLKIDFDADHNLYMYINWEKIKRHIRDEHFFPLDNCSLLDEEHEQIALICRQFGKICKCDYKSEKDEEKNSTSCNAPELIKGMKTIFPNIEIIDKSYSHATVMSDIKAQKILLIFGDDHVFLADGCIDLCVQEVVYNSFPNLPPNPPILKFDHYGSLQQIEYIHINWGWHGCENGYFSPNVLEKFRNHQTDNSEYGHVNDPFSYDASKLKYIPIAL